MQNEHSKGFFVFTKKEKRGVIAISVLLLFIFLAAEYLYPLVIREEPVPVAEIDSAGSLLKQMPADSSHAYNSRYPAKSDYSSSYKKYDNGSQSFTGKLFYFDPNTIDAAGWQRLGVKEKTALTIEKYISKGGRFRSPDDINKIWGLRDEEKQRLIPYVRIAEAPSFSSTEKKENYSSYEKKSYEKKSTAPVDINTGDSTSFAGLPGIGPGYSRRIVNFRNKLGGFYKLEQVGETFGLPDSVFQKVKPYLKISGAVKKININTATAEELKAHPYIRWQLANIITEYRKQHGNFKNEDDLRKIMAIDEVTINKIIPYIDFK